MKKNRKKWIWIIIAIAVVAIVAAVLLLGQSSGNAGRYAEETVRHGTIETYYSFSGNVAVRDSQEINAKANATIGEIYVEEDAQVKAGDPLIRLSNGDIVKADIDGEVTKIHVSQNDTVAMGAPLVDIANFDDLQVLVKVDEFDAAAVTVGKEVTATIDALGLTYQSVVEHMSKQAIILETSDISYYEAKLSAPEDEHILPGMKVDVKMLNEQATDTPLLSMDALQFDAYNKPYVLMRGNGTNDVIQVAVGVGIQDGTTVQITSGLRSGDVVLVPQSNGTMFPMMNGMR